MPLPHIATPVSCFIMTWLVVAVVSVGVGNSRRIASDEKLKQLRLRKIELVVLLYLMALEDVHHSCCHCWFCLKKIRDEYEIIAAN